RLGKGPTKYYENAKVIKGDKAVVDRITNHVLGDACTPGNAKECTFDTVRPVVEHCMNGSLDELLPCPSSQPWRRCARRSPARDTPPMSAWPPRCTCRPASTSRC